MKLPFERHILWLYIEGKTPEDVKTLYDRWSFPIPERDDLRDLKDQADTMPMPGSTRRRIEKGVFLGSDLQYMKKHGLDEFYLQKLNPEALCPEARDGWKEIWAFLPNPVARVAVEACLIAKLPESDVLAILPQLYPAGLTPRALEIFRAYFFEVGSFARPEWRDYTNLLKDNAYVYLRYVTALTKQPDELLFLLELPTKKTFTKFLRNVLETADYRFRNYVRQDNPNGDDRARKWAKLGIEAGERYEKMASADVTDFSEKLQSEFEYVEGDVPTLPTDLLSQIKPPEKPEVAGNVPNAPVFSLDPENY